jgi:hypothetical protein
VAEAFDRTRTENRELGVLTRDRAAEGEPGKKPDNDRREKVFDGGNPEVVRSPEARQGDTAADKLDSLSESRKLDISPQYRRPVEKYLGKLSEQ